jgi:WD40 repeat protein
MDIFSAGCIIAEIFQDGKDPLFSYADLLAFVEGKAPNLSNIPDGYGEMIQSMIKRCPNDRPTAKDLLYSDIFPASFQGFLFQKMSAYKDRDKHRLKGTRGDDVIRRLKTDLKDFLSKLSRETLVIPLSLILSAIRSCDFHQSWFDGFDILVQMSTKLDPTIVLERIMPTLLKFTRENDSRLRAASLTALHEIILHLDITGLSEQVCEQNAEYLLKVRNVTEKVLIIVQDLKDLANDDMFHVKRVYAKYIGTFGRFCYLLSKRCQDDHVSEAVRSVINDCVTNVMTDDSAEINREFLHSSVIKLAEVLGATNIGDTILKHMITFLNKNHSWMLRAEMYNSLPKVLKSIGLSGDLVDVLRGPIQEGLTDSEDPVILAALKCFTCLVEASLMSKSLTLDVARRVTPFLLHPNSAIMLTAARFFVTLGQKMNTAEKMVKLIPVVSKFMKKKNHAALNSLQTFLTFLRPPLSRLVYEQIISGTFTRELIKLLRDYPHHELDELEDLVNSEALDEFLKDTSNSSSSWEITQKRRKFANLLSRLNQIPMQQSDREALELMSNLLETRHLKKHARTPMKITSGTIYLDEIEGERQRRPSRSMGSVKIRNVAHLKVELSKNEKDRNVLDKKILWATSYFEHNLPNKKELEKEGTKTIERYSNSRIALREIVYEKRKEIREQCEEDLMDVSDENFDGFDGSSNDQWLPQGRLVGHIQEHTGSINEITVNPKCSFMCSAGNDGFVKTWSIDQFWNYSNPSEALKSKNQWRPDSEMAIKRVQFCDNSKIAIVAQKENPDSLSTGCICYSDIEMFKTPLWNKVIDAKYGIVTDLCTTQSDKGQILAATSAGHILALDPRSKHTVSQSYELEHDVRLGGITSICSNQRQQWLAAATARGSVVVWDLRYQLRVINFQDRVRIDPKF